MGKNAFKISNTPEKLLTILFKSENLASTKWQNGEFSRETGCTGDIVVAPWGKWDYWKTKADIWFWIKENKSKMKWHVEFHQIPWDTSGSANPDGEHTAHLFRVILFSHTEHKNPLKMMLLFVFIFLWEKLALCWHQPLSLAGNFSQGEKKIERMIFKTKKMTWLHFFLFNPEDKWMQIHFFTK